MKEEDILIKKYGKDSGMKIPDGFFEDFEKKVMAELPPYVAPKPATIELSKWQRIKPYIYLAAMFCGIWLMMKLFHTVSEPFHQGFNNPPEAIVQLLDGDYEDMNYILGSPDYMLEEEVAMEFDSMEDFEKAFYANL